MVDMNLFDDVVPVPKDTAHTKEHWLGPDFKKSNMDGSSIKLGSQQKEQYSKSELPSKGEENKAIELEKDLQSDAQ